MALKENNKKLVSENMKRYFEIIDKRITLEVDITGFMSLEKIEKHFDTKLRELDKKEFNKLTKEYTT
ncbi:hypothetical protein [uncultured Clostridium sp.]|uniref:hypothetical protein n=1 Tax=uncultured Clostridium sp. TaxID=59620 RepID=UPI00262624DB|nr:hypothetical protein [uncultured Clostridium sp.]